MFNEQTFFFSLLNCLCFAYRKGKEEEEVAYKIKKEKLESEEAQWSSYTLALSSYVT